jgi:prevent-host-death family protein
MYIAMKRYSVSQARMRMAEVLDSAERGEPVVIERQGVRFDVVMSKAKPRAKRRRDPIIKILDPAVEAGDWTWRLEPTGLQFVPFPGRTRR